MVVGLPAYNEAENLRELIENILSQDLPDLKLFFVDDGSDDSTPAILNHYCRAYQNVYFIRHDTNRGLGGAMNTIITHAVESFPDDETLITFDADNTHDPSLIPAMLERLYAERLDIVIASRFAAGATEIGVPFLRKLYSRGAYIFCRLVFRVENVRDYSCGYRIYRVGLLRRMLERFGRAVEAEGFECMLELLVRAGAAGAKIGEYPLRLNYSLKKGESKMHTLKTILGYFRVKQRAFKLRSW